MIGSLPQDAAARKASPMAEGLLWYFPNALAAVAAVSKAGDDQHNPGEPMHHARGKSMDHADCIIRHLVDAGAIDTDGQRHTAKVAWRALALLQEEIEREEGAPLPRNARLDASRNARNLYDETSAIHGTQEAKLDGSRIATAAELRPYGIGDVERRHPMAAEAERIATQADGYRDFTEDAAGYFHFKPSARPDDRL